ncbi:hypothetical protein L1D34_23190 [Vibrio mediterranei]|jgi:hypothetical protein|uniref:hypothetical protein n=1 Tax=Vibrio mediterranei TaxID=689 RepID=UPI001EFE3CCB|nr:hypothetical protein [Vibrio mediterranei]MCG9627742.1 hypothetical protein [Vibrio mediterranei]
MKRAFPIIASTILFGCGGGGSGGDGTSNDGTIAVPSKPFPEGSCAAYVLVWPADQSDEAIVSRDVYVGGKSSPAYIGEWKQMDDWYCSELDKWNIDYVRVNYKYDSFLQQFQKGFYPSTFVTKDEANNELVKIGSSIVIDNDNINYMEVQYGENLSKERDESQYWVYWRAKSVKGYETYDPNRASSSIEFSRSTHQGVDGVLVRGSGFISGSDRIRWDYQPMADHFREYYFDRSAAELWFDQVIHELDFKG